MKNIKLFLDVDGVINAYARTDASENLWGVPYQSNKAAGYTIVWTPALAAALQHLNLDHAWLTAWLHRAPEHIAPLIGYGEESEHIPFKRIGNNTIYGKVQAVRAWRALNPHTPFVHIDDEFGWHPAVAEIVVELGGLAVAPDPEHGITPDDIAAIREYIDAHEPEHEYRELSLTSGLTE